MTISYKTARRLFALAGLAALAGCLNTNEAPDIPSDPAHEHFAPSLGIDSGLTSFNKTTHGVYYKDTQLGTGGQLDSLTVVTWSFQTYLADGEEVDFQAHENIDLSVVKVAGLLEGILGYGATGGMREGGQRIIVVPSALAYGNQPQGSIPANATLVFFVSLESVG